jgi:hypothetical protein
MTRRSIYNISYMGVGYDSSTARCHNPLSTAPTQDRDDWGACIDPVRRTRAASHALSRGVGTCQSCPLLARVAPDHPCGTAVASRGLTHGGACTQVARATARKAMLTHCTSFFDGCNTVRARPGGSAPVAFSTYSKWSLCGVCVWAGQAVNHRTRRFPARAVLGFQRPRRGLHADDVLPGAPASSRSLRPTNSIHKIHTLISWMKLHRSLWSGRGAPRADPRGGPARRAKRRSAARATPASSSPTASARRATEATDRRTARTIYPHARVTVILLSNP